MSSGSRRLDRQWYPRDLAPDLHGLFQARRKLACRRAGDKAALIASEAAPMSSRRGLAPQGAGSARSPDAALPISGDFRIEWAAAPQEKRRWRLQRRRDESTSLAG